MGLTESLKKQVRGARLTFGNNAILDDAEERQEFFDFQEEIQKALLSQVTDITSDQAFIDNLLLLTNKAEVNQNLVLLLGQKLIPIKDKLKEGLILSFLLFAGNQGGQAQIDQMTVQATPFLLENEEITQTLRNISLQLAKTLDETTKKDIARMLESGRKNLLTNAEIASMIASKYETISATRAYMIARNELANAVNMVSYETMRRNGVTEVRWVTVLDDRVCPICSPLHNEVVSISTNFTGTTEDSHGIKHQSFSGERPPAHVNCRCYLEEVITGFDVRDERIVWTGA